MAKITWLGEDSAHTRVDGNGNPVAGGGPEFNTWNGIRFDRGKPVKVDDPGMIAKARKNQFFRVDDAMPDLGTIAPNQKKEAAATAEVSVTTDLGLSKSKPGDYTTREPKPHKAKKIHHRRDAGE